MTIFRNQEVNIMAYESIGKDISEPSEPKEPPKPSRPKLEKPTPPLPTPKPPALAKDVSTISKAYEDLRKKIGNHWDAKPTINKK